MAAGPIDPPPLPARLAERYVLEERLADGGSAEVWLARDPVLDRSVAIKVLHRHLLSDPTMRARLEQEARAAAGLSHPGIVTVHDVDVDDTAAAVVLEYVDGETLADRLLRAGPLPPAEAARIAAEVADALAHAHERGVIHRDVKPANVLIESDGRARLVDFGIARVMEDAENRLTTTGTVAGTLRYLAPEQLRGETAGPAADVYGVGVVLAEMLTGHPPYEANSPLELAEAQRLPPEPIAGVPSALAEIVQRCLDPDPERRPPSAAALSIELRDWLAASTDPDAQTATFPVVGAIGPAAVAADSMAIGDSPTTPADPTTPTSATIEAIPMVEAMPAAESMPSPAVPPSETSRPTRRTLWPLVAAVIAIVLVVIIGASLLGSPSGPSSGADASASASAASTPASVPTSNAGTTGAPPAKPKTLAAAVAAFDAAVIDGVKRGSIDRKSANDLRRRAGDLTKNNAKRDDVSTQIDDLRARIDELERAGRITSAAEADNLRAAVDAIEATTNG